MVIELYYLNKYIIFHFSRQDRYCALLAKLNELQHNFPAFSSLFSTFDIEKLLFNFFPWDSSCICKKSQEDIMSRVRYPLSFCFTFVALWIIWFVIGMVYFNSMGPMICSDRRNSFARNVYDIGEIAVIMLIYNTSYYCEPLLCSSQLRKHTHTHPCTYTHDLIDCFILFFMYSQCRVFS